MADNRSFLQLLGIGAEQYHTIAVVGGGGKTSLIYRLTEELLCEGKKVIITTTTHMAFEPKRPFALDGEDEKIRYFLEKEGYVIAAGYEPETDKYASLSEKKLKALLKYDAAVLIEADGAKKKPVKVPGEWEPVIPDFAEAVIGVIGLDCLYKPIGEASHRAEKTAAFLGKTAADVLLPEDIVKIAASAKGLRKNIDNRAYYVYLNKADTLPETETAAEIAAGLKKQNIEAVYGSLKEKEI